MRISAIDPLSLSSKVGNIREPRGDLSNYYFYTEIAGELLGTARCSCEPVILLTVQSVAPVTGHLCIFLYINGEVYKGYDVKISYDYKPERSYRL